MAGEETQRRGPHPCRPAQRQHNAHKITAPLGRTHSTYDKPPTPQETTIWRATRRKALSLCPKEAFPWQLKGLPLDIYHRPWLLESLSTGQIWMESRNLRGHQDIWSQQNIMQQSSLGRERYRQDICSGHHTLPTLPETLPREDRLDKSPPHPPYKSNPSPTKLRPWSCRHRRTNDIILFGAIFYVLLLTFRDPIVIGSFKNHNSMSNCFKAASGSFDIRKKPTSHLLN